MQTACHHTNTALLCSPCHICNCSSHAWYPTVTHIVDDLLLELQLVCVELAAQLVLLAC
jgi:hypothetical protein